MNNARLSKSPRLQKVYEFLLDGLRHSTMEIISACKVCAVNSIVAELRENGIKIDCKREGDSWYYQILSF